MTRPRYVSDIGPAVVFGAAGGGARVTYFHDGDLIGAVTYADAETAIETANAWHSLMQDPPTVGWNTAS